jgi:WD40 repeat protein
MITAMKISADGKKLLIGDLGGNLKLISLTDGTTIKDFGYLHDSSISGIVITADEKFFFTSGSDGTLKQWNYEDTTLFRDYGKITDCICCLCL